MRCGNYLKVNGETIMENASLQDLRLIMSKLNLKLVQCYTFEMKLGFRRVFKLEAQGVVYSVYGPKRYIDAYAYSQDCLYFGFDKSKAYSLNGEVSEFQAKDINFAQPHFESLWR